VFIALLADGVAYDFVNGVYRSKSLPGELRKDFSFNDDSDVSMKPLGSAGNIWASTYAYWPATWVLYQQYGPVKAGTFLEFDYAVADVNTIFWGATSFKIQNNMGISGINQQVQCCLLRV
jgi:hypothetical protein